MDSSGRDITQSPASVSSPRKRAYENETPSQRQKREKAAVRQRRKRERDRTSNGVGGIMAFPQPTDHESQQTEQQHDSQGASLSQPLEFSSQDLSPEEAARRDRVRAGARERQRRHRQLVKQKKMRELGLDMGNEIMPGMEEVHYRVNAEGQYQQVLPHELQPNPQSMGQQEPPFPQGQAFGGQTFASTLLLSFSCAPLLKQHLLRTLSMSNEELASLEPVIAEAWDRWDNHRRMQYAEQVGATKNGGPSVAGTSNFQVDINHDHSANNHFPQDPSQGTPNEFRARFHRSLVAPSPFRNFNESSTTATTSAPASASGAPSDPIDPTLNSHGPGQLQHAFSASGINHEFGQARGGADGLIGRLEV